MLGKSCFRVCCSLSSTGRLANKIYTGGALKASTGFVSAQMPELGVQNGLGVPSRSLVGVAVIDSVLLLIGELQNLSKSFF